MADKTTSDDSSKKAVSRRVITPKRKYFFPEHSLTVDAVDYRSALTQLKKHKAGKQEN